MDVRLQLGVSNLVVKVSKFLGLEMKAYGTWEWSWFGQRTSYTVPGVLR